jgi:hypothetical protein
MLHATSTVPSRSSGLQMRGFGASVGPPIGGTTRESRHGNLAKSITDGWHCLCHSHASSSSIPLLSCKQASSSFTHSLIHPPLSAHLAVSKSLCQISLPLSRISLQVCSLHITESRATNGWEEISTGAFRRASVSRQPGANATARHCLASESVIHRYKTKLPTTVRIHWYSSTRLRASLFRHTLFCTRTVGKLDPTNCCR